MNTKPLPKIGRPGMGPLLKTGIQPLLHDDIVKIITAWPEDFTVNSSDEGALAVAALWPEKMVDDASVGFQRHFSRLYAAHPDFVLHCLKEIRKLWKNPDHKFLVKKFLLSRHGWIDDKTHINDEGKMEALEAALRDEIERTTGVNVKVGTVKRARQEMIREQ